MPGANWTRKDYQAVAEMIGDIGHLGNDVTHEDMSAEVFSNLVIRSADHCLQNAKLDLNGNRNFQRGRYVDECYKQAGRTFVELLANMK